MRKRQPTSYGRNMCFETWGLRSAEQPLQSWGLGSLWSLRWSSVQIQLELNCHTVHADQDHKGRNSWQSAPAPCCECGNSSDGDLAQKNLYICLLKLSLCYHNEYVWITCGQKHWELISLLFFIQNKLQNAWRVTCWIYRWHMMFVTGI